MKKLFGTLLFMFIIFGALILSGCVHQPQQEVQQQEQKVWTEEQQKLDSQLIIAANKGDLIEVKDLLAKGADANAKDEYGRTALMEASKWDRKEIAELLINKGADVNAKDKWGDTALSWASMWSNMDMIKLLKKAGAKE